MAVTRVAPKPVTMGSTAFMKVRVTKVLNTVVTALKYVLPSYVVMALLTCICVGCQGVSLLRKALTSLEPTIMSVVTGTKMAVLVSTFFVSNAMGLVHRGMYIRVVVFFIVTLILLHGFGVGPVLTVILYNITGIILDTMGGTWVAV